MVDTVFDLGGSGNSVTVTGQVVYGTIFEDERWGQHSLRVGDGSLVTYDNAGINVVNGEIRIKAVEYANGEELRTWIREKAVYKLNQFTITTPSGVDLGNGKGNSLLNVNYDKFDMKGIFKFKAPGLYDIIFPYTFVRGGNLSTSMNIIITCQGTLTIT